MDVRQQTILLHSKEELTDLPLHYLLSPPAVEALFQAIHEAAAGAAPSLSLASSGLKERAGR